MQKASEFLCLGIDLGTSRSVVSADTGQRRWTESYVGWPKDFIAQKWLGKRVLIGAEALEKRLSVNLVRPLANGVIRENTEKDEESVTELIGHLIQLIGPDSEKSIRAAVGVPAQALKVNKLAIKRAVSNFADKLIVISEPFAVAYGVNALGDAMIVDIGAGTVDFCIMHGAVPDEDDEKSLLTACDYIDQQLYELLLERYPQTDFNLNMARHFKEQYGFVGQSPNRVLVTAPVQGKLVEHDITVQIRQACESIMPAIAETIMDMIAKFDPEFQDKVRRNIILAGGGSQIAGIEAYLTQTMHDFAPCSFSRVDDPLYAGAEGALGLARDMPAQYWDDL